MNEITLQFGPSAGLVGTITLPRDNLQSQYALILFNAGVVPRIGPNRLNVRIARAFVANDIPTLRFDLSGRGDSAPARGMLSFEQQAVVDLQAAMDLMTQRTGAQRFLLMGMCSGAENAYHTALADERVVAISMLDSYHFPTLRTHFNRYRLRAQRRGGLTKAGFGWLRHRLHVLLTRKRQVRSTITTNAAATSFGSIRPTAQEFATKLRRLLDRGVAIDLLFSGSFVETYNYADQFRDVFQRYGIVQSIHVEYRADLDHTLSTASMQQQVVARACAWFGEVIKKTPSGNTGSRKALTELAMLGIGAIPH